MLTVYPSQLESDLAATSTALRSVVATLRRELARPQSTLHDFPVPVQALLLSARHCVADLDRLAAILDNSEL